MKFFINKITFLVLFTLLAACGGDEKETNKKAVGKGKTAIGDIVITVNDQTYKLELEKCYSRITEKNSLFLINTKKQKSSPQAPFFTSQGTNGKGFSASYSFLPEGSEMDGGTKYFGTMPFEKFQNKQIIFKGEAKSINLGDGVTAINGVAPIEFKVTCY